MEERGIQDITLETVPNESNCTVYRYTVRFPEGAEVKTRSLNISTEDAIAALRRQGYSIVDGGVKETENGIVKIYRVYGDAAVR